MYIFASGLAHLLLSSTSLLVARGSPTLDADHGSNSRPANTTTAPVAGYDGESTTMDSLVLVGDACAEGTPRRSATLPGMNTLPQVRYVDSSQEMQGKSKSSTAAPGGRFGARPKTTRN